MRRPVPPRLDDRSFDQLRAEAIERIKAACPEWTDFSPSDPGIALAEVFAYLTQTLLYRVNRVPDKQYRAFLGLLGISELPPAAATTRVTFLRSGGGARLEIPRGTVLAAGPEPFTTLYPAVFEDGASEAATAAFHGELVDGELLGIGTGAPGLERRVARFPIVAPMEDGLDLVVAVEETEPLPPEARAVQFGGKTFRVWREVSTFAELEPGERAYTVDRQHGIIRFPPAMIIDDERGRLIMGDGAVGAVPPQGREIRVSYRTGGGALGNVRAGAVVTPKSPLPGITVTNPAPATGGREAEPLDSLLLRGPTDFHRLERAVTARDYETLARRAGGIARAKAFTKAEIWRHAAPGVVEVRLVPTLGEGDGQALEDLRQRESLDELAKVQRALDDARPLGSRCEVRWSAYKPVSVTLRAVAARQEDRVAVRERILARLERLITPLPRSVWDEGWAYGRTLRRYDIEGTVRAEPGVLYVTGVELRADRMPEGPIPTVAVDAHEPRTWYVGSRRALYRSTNGGDGWELLHELRREPEEEAEQAWLVRTSRWHPGLVAAVVRVGPAGCRTYVSRDCGETWASAVTFQEALVRDVAWSDRNGTPVLFHATDKGLYEYVLGAASPLLVEVEPARPDQGFTSLVVYRDVRGIEYLAVATNDGSGVYVSRQAGQTRSFANAGLSEIVIRLAVQTDGVRSFLWAGFAHPANGAARYELDRDVPEEGWVPFSDGWGDAGSCLALAFTRDGLVLAGSHSRGVLWLAPKVGAAWRQPGLDCGLPLRGERVDGETRLLVPVETLAVDASTARPELDRIVVGTQRGVHRAPAPDRPYEDVTDHEHLAPPLREVVTLPPTWLFCSGRHDVIVESEDGLAAQGEA